MVSLARQVANISVGGELPAGEYSSTSDAFAFMAPITERLDRLERNLCINGNFDFWQRGAGPLSISNAAVGRLADRFNFRPSATNGTGSMTRSTSVPTLAESGFQSTYSLQVTAPASGGASSANTTTSIDTRLEGFDYASLHGRPARFSFWVRSSLIGTYHLALCNSDHSREYLASYTISVANTWEKKTIDVPLMDSSGTWLFDNGIGLAVHWVLQVGNSRQGGSTGSWFTKTGDGAPIAAANQADMWGTASATFHIAQVMIVPGDLATTSIDIPFQRCGRSIQDELVTCQRYFQTVDLTNYHIAFSTTASAGIAPNPIVFPVEMRATPTLTATSLATTLINIVANTSAASTLTIQGQSTRQGRMYPSGASNGIVYGFTGVPIFADAEL